MTSYLRPPQNVIDFSIAIRPPTWREQPFEVSYILTSDEPSGKDMIKLYRWALAEGLPNPRIISPFVLSWSSLFNPRFYWAMQHKHGVHQKLSLPVRLRNESNLVSESERARFYLQSMLFLAGVTLSAAIVQSRWSNGTIASKYDRLWQAGALAKDGIIPELRKHNLMARVSELSAEKKIPDNERLLVIRRIFEAAISTLGEEIKTPCVNMQVNKEATELSKRFGFVDELRGSVVGLSAIIVYGSSVNSENFADYDVLIITEKPEVALRNMAGTSPLWQGKELNVGIYSPEEIWRMQLLSGDNLADYGLCIYGAVELPQKPIDVLLARNMSFGMVRQRQQLGMIGSALTFVATDEGDNRNNLYEYFVKIPANIAKGSFGVLGKQHSKNEIQQWLYDLCGFDAKINQIRARTGDPGGALAEAAVATGAVMRGLNRQLKIVSPDSEYS